jgi:hypothetical protein
LERSPLKTSRTRVIKARAARYGRRSSGIAIFPGSPEGSREVNRAHARICAIGERAVATLKAWKVLTKLRCCPHRANALVQAILVLRLVEVDRYSG